MGLEYYFQQKIKCREPYNYSTDLGSKENREGECQGYVNFSYVEEGEWVGICPVCGMKYVQEVVTTWSIFRS